LQLFCTTGLAIDIVVNVVGSGEISLVSEDKCFVLAVLVGRLFMVRRNK